MFPRSTKLSFSGGEKNAKGWKRKSCFFSDTEALPLISEEIRFELLQLCLPNLVNSPSSLSRRTATKSVAFFGKEAGGTLFPLNSISVPPLFFPAPSTKSERQSVNVGRRFLPSRSIRTACSVCPALTGSPLPGFSRPGVWVCFPVRSGAAARD